MHRAKRAAYSQTVGAVRSTLLGRKDSRMSSWWETLRWNQTSVKTATEAENAVIARANVPCEITDTPVGPRPDHTIHSISAGDATGTPIVCMPGYAAGAAFFYRNLKGLSRHARVHLVDWLGTGLSGRPPFTCRTREETEDWFVDSLERWRVAQGHERIVLVGHSLGGYLSASYALKYPERVVHLVLVNPAGMSERPPDLPLPEAVRSPLSFGGAMYRMATGAWNCGVTPGSIVRTFGPFSRRFTRGYADRRMHQSLGLPRDECDTFEPYMYEVLGGKGSGEFALRKLLKPFAWAQYPMEDRLGDLKPPVTFIYGENDWMDPAAGERVCLSLAKAGPDPAVLPSGIRAALAQPDARANRFRNKVLYIDDSSHFPFMEKPAEFDGMLLDVVGYCLPGCKVELAEKAEYPAGHHGMCVDESNEGVTVDALETAFVDA